MTRPLSVELRARLVEICLALPEATRSGAPHIKFTVRRRTFAYYLDNHHGDGRVALCCKAPPGDQDLLLRLDAVRFFAPAYLGVRGWIGLRLDLDDVDWGEVEELVVASYQLVAPKGLAARVPVMLGLSAPAAVPLLHHPGEATADE